MAEDIMQLNPKYIHRGEINWNKFEDGFPNLFIKNVDSIRGRDVIFLASFLDQASLLAQISILYSLPGYVVRSLIVVLPYFPTATMERVDEEGQIATAHTFARLLSSIPPTLGGPTKLVIYDIHALQNRFYFGDNMIPLLVSAVPLFVDVLKTEHAKEKIVIAFPDDGAAKRFSSKFEGYQVVTCLKVREGEKRIVKLKEGHEHIPDAHVFIVDDLVKTGGTLIECKNVLQSHGAKMVSAFVTHAVFPQESWKKFAGNSGFHRFYTTDSCPEISKVIENVAPFRVLPLCCSILDSILKY
eukprot:TRINITY_DN15274_c0_g1_i1.p1 TRINITY_DN15274_c0_g1~~TRINITY_DN15274_c0_g1_i1.p1  ORF type:complete len:340 (+),score=95.42 TRINITY_DN15274_c0_g1_i1:124-1020(+)